MGSQMGAVGPVRLTQVRDDVVGAGWERGKWSESGRGRRESQPDSQVDGRVWGQGKDNHTMLSLSH